MKTYLKKHGRHPVFYWDENKKHSYEELSEMVTMILNDDVREYPNVNGAESNEDMFLGWIKHA